MDNLIVKLYQSKQTILTSKNIALLWEETNADNLKSKIAYYVKKGVLIRLSRGIFAKDRNYNPRELATGIYSPSYISFETVLREAGIIFQHYDAIFVAGPWPLTKKIDEHIFIFRKLKNILLFNPQGVLNKDNYWIASPERAFLDTIYLYPNYYFDNLGRIDWEQCQELVKIYNNKELRKRLDKYQRKHAK